MINTHGFRLNVGIVLTDRHCRVFWGKRAKEETWQFPQGGILPYETPYEAMLRELEEEIGLQPSQVEIISYTKHWLYYRLPPHLIRYHRKPLCIGQKQRWYLLRLLGEESEVCLQNTSRPEFDDWRWVNYWYPLEEVVFFKRKVYSIVLKEFASSLRRNKRMFPALSSPPPRSQTVSFSSCPA